jgi:hypothetical protein
LVAPQTHPELEIFVFKGKELGDDELDHALDLDWAHKNADKVLYLAVKKNRNSYDAYRKNAQKYQSVVERWIQA